MLISPQTAIENGWITWNKNVVTDITPHIQPNALDFDCSRVFVLDQQSPAMLVNNEKQLRSLSELELTDGPNNLPVWVLQSGQCYDFTSSFYCELPQGVSCELIIRSTLNRCGVFITSGLYDSGYKGSVAGILHVDGGPFVLGQYQRIGQIKFYQSEASGISYAGGYSHSSGTHWTDAK